MNQKSGSDNALVLSYLGLRKAIGIIGTALPFVLAIGNMLFEGPGIERSMSYYYYTIMRGVLVGSLCAMGVFLLSYRGYERRDDIAGDLACIFAVGVALFPTTPDGNPTSTQVLIGTVHLVFAALFILVLAYFSLVLFRKSNPKKAMTRRKRQRNLVYTVCGYTMLVCLVLLGLVQLPSLDTLLEPYDPVFWLEAVAVVSFGISWFTKGEGILKDLEGEATNWEPLHSL